MVLPFCVLYCETNKGTHLIIIVQDLSKEVHHHVIDSLRKDHDIESIDYGGCYGDPLMHPKVLELLQYGEGIYQEVQTNASLQTDKFWQSVAKIDKLRMWFHLDKT